MKKPRVIVNLRVALLFLAVLFILPAILPHSAYTDDKGSSEELLIKADAAYENKDYQEAWKLYDLLVRKYKSFPAISGKLDKIKQRKSECEKTLGIVTDIDDVFKGKAELTGTGKKQILTLSYDFEDKEQAEDFLSESGAIKVKDGELIFDTQGGSALFNIKNAMFNEQVTIEAKMTICSPSSGQVGVIMFLNTDTVEGYLFCCRLRVPEDPTSLNNAIVRISNKDEAPAPIKINGKPEIKLDTQYTIKAEGKNQKLKFYINKKEIFDATGKDFTKGMIGVIASSAKIKFDDFKISGQADDEWLKKLFSESTTLALAEKDLEKAAEQQFMTVEKLSAEDPKVLGKVSQKAKNTWTKAREKADAMENSSNFESFQAEVADLIEEYDKVIAEDKTFALAYYERALLNEQLDDDSKAQEDLDGALEAMPGFYEAAKIKGDICVKNSQFDNALSWYNKSVEINPKYSFGYSSRAYLYFITDDVKSAESDLDKALKLKDDNVEALNYRRNIKHVTDGPKWPVCYEKETEHYIVKTDISQERCDLYADSVDAMYKYYSKMFPLKEKPRKKGKVYIFNTQAGYQVHAALTTDDLMQFTLGYYNPAFRELYLFEEPNKQDATKKVLFHEGFHQYIHNAMERTPIWFNEGCAEWFYGTTVKGKAIAEKGELIPRLEDLKEGLTEGKCKPLKWLMNATSREFMNIDPNLNYAQAWSIIHFCINYENGRYSEYIGKYYNALKSGKSAKEAFSASFGALAKFDDMEEAWKKYVERLR
ncbi:MAG: DUF1570 domain-containing protein [Planctomycetes bacterium]|nr:DUF1570 domain-containing protein [Planctomycetota bacterium]